MTTSIPVAAHTFPNTVLATQDPVQALQLAAKALKDKPITVKMNGVPKLTIPKLQSITVEKIKDTDGYRVTAYSKNPSGPPRHVGTFIFKSQDLITFTETATVAVASKPTVESDVMPRALAAASEPHHGIFRTSEPNGFVVPDAGTVNASILNDELKRFENLGLIITIKRGEVVSKVIPIMKLVTASEVKDEDQLLVSDGRGAEFSTIRFTPGTCIEVREAKAKEIDDAKVVAKLAELRSTPLRISFDSGFLRTKVEALCTGLKERGWIGPEAAPVYIANLGQRSDPLTILSVSLVDRSLYISTSINAKPFELYCGEVEIFQAPQ